jgi:hypothetical protein
MKFVVEHVARMEEAKNPYNIFAWKLKNLGIDEWIILAKYHKEICWKIMKVRIILANIIKK